MDGDGGAGRVDHGSGVEERRGGSCARLSSSTSVTTTQGSSDMLMTWENGNIFFFDACAESLAEKLKLGLSHRRELPVHIAAASLVGHGGIITDKNDEGSTIACSVPNDGDLGTTAFTFFFSCCLTGASASSRVKMWGFTRFFALVRV